MYVIAILEGEDMIKSISFTMSLNHPLTLEEGESVKIYELLPLEGVDEKIFINNNTVENTEENI